MTDQLDDQSSGDLHDGELELTGRIMAASNATFLGRIGEQQVVYKPVAGERPLWDFPDGTLAEREVAAHAVSQVLGWNVVPRTWLRDGPHGVGMVQLWCEVDADQSAVTLVPAGRVPAGWHAIFDGLDQDDRPITLVHEESAALRRMAVFDVLVNNADRKGGHILEMTDGHRYGVDHGLTFHVDPKLRTVLWGWIGEQLTDDERSGVGRVLTGLGGALADRLGELLTSAEVEALGARCSDLLAQGTLPPPGGDFALPWPPF